MGSFRQRIVAQVRFRALAYFVLLISLLPVGIAYWRVGKNVEARDLARFNFVAARAHDLVRDSLESYLAELPAISGFVEARASVTMEEWNAFIDSLELGRRHPGIQSVGFAEKVRLEERPEFLARLRHEAGPGYDIFPAPPLLVSFPTVCIKAFSTNAELHLGWDAAADPGRRAVIEEVYKTGRPALTERSVYRNRDGGTAVGFTVYAPSQATNNSSARAGREPRGVLFSSFIPQLLFSHFSSRAATDLIALELFDGGPPRAAGLLASIGAGPRLARASFQDTVDIRLLGRTYPLRISTLPAFDSYSERNFSKSVLAAGVALSFLLFGVVWTQTGARKAAERLNGRLRDSEERLRMANTELQTNISEARRTEELLAYERDLLRTLLDHSPDRIYFKDRDSRFIKCGKSVVGRMGLSDAAQATGRTDFHFFTEEHARPAFELEKEIMRGGQPVIGLVEKETWRDGHESWVLTSKMPLRDKHGVIIGTFGISKDITELKTAGQALQKEKELLGVTLRSIADGVITTDVAGRIVLFNTVAEQVTGWAQAEAVGRPLAEVFQTGSWPGPADPDPAGPIRHDAVLVDRAGQEKNISESLASIIDHEGRTVGAVLVFRDITEKLKIEAELLKASKLESIGVLAGGIAHDFNNILTVILGNISLARLSDSAGVSMNDPLAEAEKASLRARELTHRLLTFAKGGAPIKKALDLAPLMRDCAARCLEGTDVRYEVFVGDNLWMVQADESQFVQVTTNLINYARASMSREPRLDIHVLNQEMTADPLLLLKPGKYVRVSIRDFGTGIRPENLSKIFEPYFSGKKPGAGHGLELATAYSIIRKHDGQIRVESISGQGTVFHIYLPALENASPVVARPEGRVQPNLAVPRRILVMDDELPIRKIAALMLQNMGHTAVTVADGAEALVAYVATRQAGEPFDAVIMDLTIPHGLGGKETIGRLKAIDPAVRAVVCSGYSHDPVMASHREYGFVGVMPKPYSAEDLARTLNELFAGDSEPARPD